MAFYGDWTVHSELDRSERCLATLEFLADLFLRSTTKWCKENEIYQEMNTIAGVPRLRSEIVDLLAEKDLQVVGFVDDQNWRRIFGLLAQTLIGRPIQLVAKRRGVRPSPSMCGQTGAA